MNFVKLGDMYVNFDNVATVEEVRDKTGCVTRYVIHFVGQTHFRSVSSAEMSNIRERFLE